MSHDDSLQLLRWIFQRGNQTLICRVDRQLGDHSYTLSIVPQANAAAGSAESFGTAWSAFERHAMIASELRRSGWTLAAYTTD